MHLGWCSPLSSAREDGDQQGGEVAAGLTSGWATSRASLDRRPDAVVRTGPSAAQHPAGAGGPGIRSLRLLPVPADVTAPVCPCAQAPAVAPRARSRRFRPAAHRTAVAPRVSAQPPAAGEVVELRVHRAVTCASSISEPAAR